MPATAEPRAYQGAVAVPGVLPVGAKVPYETCQPPRRKIRPLFACDPSSPLETSAPVTRDQLGPATQAPPNLGLAKAHHKVGAALHTRARVGLGVRVPARAQGNRCPSQTARRVDDCDEGMIMRRTLV